MEPHRGYFETVPTVESIEPSDLPDTYRVTLREVSGRAETFVMAVEEGDIPLVTWDRDLSYRWPGDAASLRAVFNAGFDTHHRRSAERLLEREADLLHVKARLAQELAKSGRSKTDLTFNVTNVRIDFDSGTATVDDELDPKVSVTVPLEALRRYSG